MADRARDGVVPAYKTYVSTDAVQDFRASELGVRWERARIAALRSVLGGGVGGDERALLTAALEADPAGALRGVFDNSARLGASFRRYHREEQTLASLPALLAGLGVACLRGGRWSATPGGASAVYERPACSARATAGTCDYWREAIDGLVVGLGGQVRHARHRSRGHGDEACQDVLYADPESPLRFGTLPGELAERLAPVRDLVRQFRGGADLELLGVSEGVLLYRLSAGHGCGETDALQELVERSLARKVPGLRLQEMSPRPVLEAGKATPTTHEETVR